jgi:hypothetical protein
LFFLYFKELQGYGSHYVKISLPFRKRKNLST